MGFVRIVLPWGVFLAAGMLGSGCGGDVAPRLDASSPSSDASTDAGAACGRYTVAGDPSSFSPQYVKPSPAANVCAPSAILQGVASCVGSASSPEACAAFASQDGACHACLFGAGGPFVRADVGVLRNRGGCVELTEGAAGEASCGGRQQALEQCEFNACSAEKTVDECADVVTTALSDPSCAGSAAATVCSVYAKSVGACADAFPGCFASDEALAEVFCATP